MIQRQATLWFFGSDYAEWGASVCLQMLVAGGLRASISARESDTTARSMDDGTLHVLEPGIKLSWARDGSAAAPLYPHVACILGCGSEEQPVDGPAALMGEVDRARLIGQENPQSTAIYSEGMVEKFPEVTSGVGRQYTVSARHPVEAGAYLASSRIRIVGRVDSVEASLPDASIPFKPSGASELKDGAERKETEESQKIEALLCASLTALEMGVAVESVDRVVRTLGWPLPASSAHARQNGT